MSTLGRLGVPLIFLYVNQARVLKSVVEALIVLVTKTNTHYIIHLLPYFIVAYYVLRVHTQTTLSVLTNINKVRKLPYTYVPHTKCSIPTNKKNTYTSKQSRLYRDYMDKIYNTIQTYIVHIIYNILYCSVSYTGSRRTKYRKIKFGKASRKRKIKIPWKFRSGMPRCVNIRKVSTNLQYRKISNKCSTNKLDILQQIVNETNHTLQSNHMNIIRHKYHYMIIAITINAHTYQHRKGMMIMGSRDSIRTSFQYELIIVAHAPCHFVKRILLKTRSNHYTNKLLLKDLVIHQHQLHIRVLSNGK
jgi:hypothetical protein